MPDGRPDRRHLRPLAFVAAAFVGVNFRRHADIGELTHEVLAQRFEVVEDDDAVVGRVAEDFLVLADRRDLAHFVDHLARDRQIRF